jgi:hypothetical protein
MSVRASALLVGVLGSTGFGFDGLPVLVRLSRLLNELRPAEMWPVMALARVITTVVLGTYSTDKLTMSKFGTCSVGLCDMTSSARGEGVGDCGCPANTRKLWKASCLKTISFCPADLSTNTHKEHLFNVCLDRKIASVTALDRPSINFCGEHKDQHLALGDLHRAIRKAD